MTRPCKLPTSINASNIDVFDGRLGEGDSGLSSARGFVLHTEELLAAAALLDDLDQTGLQLLDGGDVVGEDTHLSGLGGEVDLDDILGLVEGLQ